MRWFICLLIGVSCLLVGCIELIDPTPTLPPDTGVPEKPVEVSNPSPTPALPYTTNDSVIDSVASRTVSLGEGMFYMQLTHALDPTIGDEESLSAAIALIREALRNNNGEIKIETTQAKQEVFQGEVLVKTIPFAKDAYSLVQNRGQTLLMDYDFTRGRIVNHNALAMDFFDEYYLRSINFRQGIAQDAHYSSLTVIDPNIAYTNITQALRQGVEGILNLGLRYQGLSLWEAIQLGRLAIITGDVSELVPIDNSQIQALPVTFDNHLISIQFYSEDWIDFDYNDSFVRVNLTRQTSQNDVLSIVPNQSFTVREGVQSNTVLGYIYSFHENTIDNYVIVGDNNERFSIFFTGTNGILHTINEIDYEQQSYYELVVEVTDILGNTATGVVFVNVEKVQLTNIGGVTFVMDDDYPMEFYDNGQVSNGILAMNTVIDGVEYFGDGTEESQIILHSNGQVMLAILNQPITNNGMVFGANIAYYDDGNISDGFLIEDQTLDGVTYAGDEITSFYNNEQIRFANLSGEQTINGITYADGKNDITTLSRGATTFFHENGQVFSSRLYSNTTIGNWTYLGNTEIVFYSNGQVRGGFLAENRADYYGTFLSNTYITFFEDGGVRSGFINNLITLTLSQTGESISFTGYFERNDYNGPFYPIRQILVNQSGTFMGVNYNAGQILRFTGYTGYSENYPGGQNTVFSGSFSSFTLIRASDVPEQYPFDDEPNDLYSESVFIMLASPPPVTD